MSRRPPTTNTCQSNADDDVSSVLLRRNSASAQNHYCISHPRAQVVLLSAHLYSSLPLPRQSDVIGSVTAAGRGSLISNCRVLVSSILFLKCRHTVMPSAFGGLLLFTLTVCPSILLSISESCIVYALILSRPFPFNSGRPISIRQVACVGRLDSCKQCDELVPHYIVRFEKKHWGSPTGERVEAPQALTCNTNTGVRIDPHRSSNRRRLGGSKNHWEGWTPNPPPANRTLPH